MTVAARRCDPQPAPPVIVGRSLAIQHACSLAERFAPTGIPILLVGPTGSGKELFALYVHHVSGRRGDLVDVNCAALPRELAESLLFGHRAGAFSGAMETTTGFIAASHNGTLFLDEVCSLALDVQPKLLRALETGEVARVGETCKRKVVFGLVCAAQGSLATQVAARGFRADLFQRVAGVVIELPALAARTEDVAPLAEAFAASHGRGITAAGTVYLERRPWPGNVRQLKLTVERAAWLSRDAQLSAATLAEAYGLGQTAQPFMAEPCNVLRELCRDLTWDIPAIIRRTGLSRATLYRRFREWGVRPREERARLPAQAWVPSGEDQPQ